MENKEIKYTWDLSHMYETVESWQEDTKEIKVIAGKILSLKDSITTSAATLLSVLNLNDELGIKLTKVYVYAKMFFDQDMSKREAKELYETADSLHTKINDQLAFLEPELLNLNPETFAQYAQAEPKLLTYQHMFEKLFKKKSHIFTTEIEEILAKLNALGSSFEKIYDDMTVNDVQYPQVRDSAGNTIVANNSNYYKALISQDRTLRKNFFKGLLGTYGKYINSITSAYYGSVKHDVYLAKARKYKSAREMALAESFIPLNVYDNLITTVKKNAKVLQDYVNFRQKALKLKNIHFYDLFVPLVKNLDKTYSYEDAQELVLQATSVLGSDYTAVLKEAFTKRWIDVFPGKNKVSGAYAIEAYGYHPYSLLNFTGTLGDVFTIAHELGHVMHSYYSSQNQPFVDSDYTIFTAEVASTVNEQLLFNYLMNNSASPKEQALLLSNHLDNIRSTLFRQTLFADFESQTHQMVEEEQPLLPDLLCELHKSLYEEYHGHNFIIDEELGFEWARIPHFYRSFYVYQYATGVSAALSIANKILTKEKAAVENYRKFLTMGGSDYSINLLKIAGVDMASPAPIIDALNNFTKTFHKLKKLT
ncbi:MAG: oligoendopeptidase F [Peptococcaceae bacterium]